MPLVFVAAVMALVFISIYYVAEPLMGYVEAAQEWVAGLVAGSLAPGGQPAWFSWQGGRRRVARHWGPERIETGWWRRGLVRRDYYRVETTDGSRFWLFRQGLIEDGGGWWLHGVADA